MSCSHEHHEHGGGHDDHDHDHDEEHALKDSLYSRIDRDNIRTLNESVPNSGAKCFKPHHQKRDVTQFVESDADETLILFIPFTGTVKLKSISIWGGRDDQSPATMKAFVNREDIDFDTVESSECTQEWELSQDAPDALEYNTRVARFSSIRNLTLYFPDNFGADTTRIYYIGLRGEWSEFTKDPIITEYELFANPAKFKNVRADVGPNQFNLSR